MRTHRQSDKIVGVVMENLLNLFIRRWMIRREKIIIIDEVIIAVCVAVVKVMTASRKLW